MSKDIVKTICLEGMHCEGCVNRVKNVLNNIKEVKKVLAIMLVFIEHLKKNMDLNIIKEKIENLGFKVK